MGRKALTNKIVDSRLMGRNIKRISGYINNKIAISFQCLIEECNHIWEAIPNSVLTRHTGCPKCAKKKQTQTNKIIDIRLINRNIKRLDNYINTNYPIYFQCLINGCGHIWKTSPDKILNSGPGAQNAQE